MAIETSGDEPAVFPGTAAQAAARVRALLPEGPSDPRPLLGHAPRVAAASSRPPFVELDFLCDLRLPPAPARSHEELARMAPVFLAENLFVRTGDAAWEPLSSASPGGRVDGLRLALRLFRVVGATQLRPSAKVLEQRVRALAYLGTELGASMEPVSSVEGLEARQRQLASAWELGTAQAACMLVAPPGRAFDGRPVFDAALSAGFVWGDGDLFHGRGGELTIHTQTLPGFFLPEEALAGRLEVGDLVLTAAPLAVCPSPGESYEAMVRAVDYLQERLGGTVLGTDQKPLDVVGDTRQLLEMAATMTSFGVPPGSAVARALLS